MTLRTPGEAHSHFQPYTAGAKKMLYVADKHRDESGSDGTTIRTYSPGMTDELAGGWFAMRVSCLWCGHSWVAVFPLGTNESALECPRCGQQFSATESIESDNQTGARPFTPTP